jgi:hypothetical protein
MAMTHGNTRRQFTLGAAAFTALQFDPRRVSARSDYAQTVLAKSPVAYWRLGEQHGPTAVDAASRGHDGIYHGDLHFAEAGAISGDSNGAAA